MKIYNEDTELKSSKSLPKYVIQLEANIKDEMEAISSYDELLKVTGIPAEHKAIIQEILHDEKDHLVLLKNLFAEEVADDYKGYGDPPEDEDQNKDATPIHNLPVK